MRGAAARPSQYCEEGLLDAAEDAAGLSAAFGDDIAICGLASELRRDVVVVQVHGADGGGGGGEAAVFFLPHRPSGGVPAAAPPLWLLMRGTGWHAGGADHYEPLVARLAPPGSGPPAFAL